MVEHRHTIEPHTGIPENLIRISIGVEKVEDLVADFEQEDYAGWTVVGEAFGAGPSKGAVGRQAAFAGMVGARLANSFHADDKGRGELTSPYFELVRDYLNFRIGGGAHVGKTCMNLIVDGKVVRTATGPKQNDLVEKTWSVKELPDPATLDWPSFADVPIGLVTGTNGKTTTVRLAAHILDSAGFRAGFSRFARACAVGARGSCPATWAGRPAVRANV